MKKAAIVFTNFLDLEGKEPAVGGVETYLFYLAQLCLKKGIQPTVCQRASRGFQTERDSIKVIGTPWTGRTVKKRVRSLVDAALRQIELGKDLLIYGADWLSAPIDSNRCISIQHGVGWDLPADYSKRGWHRVFGDKLYYTMRRRQVIKYYQQCRNRVCVDYNFLNWYRTFVPVDSSGREWVIPNFSRSAPESALATRQRPSPLRILFARRFVPFRGTRIMAEATKGILRSYPNVEFTFAGEGRDEGWLRECFQGDRRVQFTKYDHDQVIDIHLRHHIAVVPSIGSEGTSFSVAEAMGCGCAVVATAVGGITNMIIDGYNGLLCLPSADQLQQRIEELIQDEKKRSSIGARAYDTAKEAFSLERWEQSWSGVIDEVIAE